MFNLNQYDRIALYQKFMSEEPIKHLVFNNFVDETFSKESTAAKNEEYDYLEDEKNWYNCDYWLCPGDCSNFSC